MPHAMRMWAAIKFMNQNRKQLLEDKLISVRSDGLQEIEEALLRALVKLDYDQNLTFSYRRVKQYVARSNKPN